MHLDDSACNLASLNLMKFRREDGELDVEAFEHAVDVVFLAQEIVVGYSSYPTPEIEANAKAYRELGLGYANLGALLMARGLPYDSDEGRAYAAAITALMTGRAYRKSAEIAARMGPHAGYQPNAAAMLGVIAKHRAAVGNIQHSDSVPSDLLKAARHAWDDALNLGEVQRLPERAGDRARAHRDDQLHDGLRHDRGRARLLARQVEEPGRRRRDHDREQDGADGPREARLRAAGDRRDRRLHRRAQHDRRRAVREVGALPGVRLRDRRPGDPLLRPREDDGRRPAVHLRRDLEDGQPARAGHGRRGRPADRRRVAPRRQGDRDLPRQLQGRAAAVRARARTRGAGAAADAAPRAAAGCRRTAPRSAASSRSATTRATSTSACTRTAAPATSSSTSPRTARRWPA